MMAVVAGATPSRGMLAATPKTMGPANRPPRRRYQGACWSLWKPPCERSRENSGTPTEVTPMRSTRKVVVHSPVSRDNAPLREPCKAMATPESAATIVARSNCYPSLSFASFIHLCPFPHLECVLSSSRHRLQSVSASLPGETLKHDREKFLWEGNPAIASNNTDISSQKTEGVSYVRRALECSPVLFV